MENNEVMLYDMWFDLANPKDDSKGTRIISLVERPAIISTYMCFGEAGTHEFKFIETDKARRIITGPVMIPNMPIKRIDEDGKVTGVKDKIFFVRASADVVEQSVWRFMKNGNKGTNLMHGSKIPEDVYLIETFYTDKQRGVLKPRDYKDCPDKTWFASYKIDNDEVYNEFIATGILKGFSLEGDYNLRAVEKQPETLLNGLERIIGNRNV